MKPTRIRSVFSAIAAIAAFFAAESASAALLATNDFEEATVSALTGFAAEGDEALSDIVDLAAFDSDRPSGAYTTEPWPFAEENFGSQYLSVDSGTNMVWRSFTGDSSKVYFDSYVKFVPITGDAEYPAGSKFAIYLDAATSNLCVVSGTSAIDSTPVTNRLTNVTVYPETWGRLTVDAVLDGSVYSFQVKVNGTLLQTAGAASTFYSLTSGTSLSQVGFKGTGAVDDMVVRTSDPFGTAASINGETFASLEQAAAEAAAGDTILLESDSNESITLSAAGIVFNTNGKNYTGTVSAASGLGWTEENGVYTAVANTAATWTDTAGDHAWSNPGNWSNHIVPAASTTVTLPGGSQIEMTGTSALPVGNLVVNGSVTITCTGDLANNYPSIGIGGGVSGAGTLTLKRVGLTSSDFDDVTVGCNVRFDGLTHDSFVQSGPFTFNGNVTVTNKFYALSKVTLNGAVTVDGASTFGIGRSSSETAGNAAVGNGATLSGSGRIVLYKSYPGDAFANLLKGNNWAGTLEVEGPTTFYGVTKINASNCGNANSIVCFNGVSGYLDFDNADSIADVKGIEIGAKGLALNNKLSDRTFVFSAPVTGSGSLVIGTTCDTISRYVFTGDMTGYSGALTVTNLHSSGSAPQVVFKPASATMTSIDTYGALVVQSGATVNVGGTWKATGGYVIDGDVTLAQNGSFGDANVGGGEVTGSGTITSTFVPSANSEKIMVPTFGDTAANTFVINGMTAGWIANANGNGMPNIKVPVRLAGNVKITNGYGAGDTESNVTTFSRLTGSGNLEFAFSTGSTYANYRITAIDGITKSGTGYTGTITLNHEKDRLTICKIDYASENDMPAYGSKVANAITVSAGTLVDTDIALTVNGVEGTRKLVKESDGYYIAVAKVGDDYYSSFEDAAEDALAADVPIDVLDGSTPSVDGWYYDSSSTQLKRIRASVINASTSAEDYYNSLADAIEDSGAGDTVKLYLASAETGVDTTGKNFVFAENGQSFTGTLTGNGTITLTAEPVSTTWSSDNFVANGWTGTVVLNYADIANNGDFSERVNSLGTSDSTVEIGANGTIIDGWCNADLTPMLKVTGYVHVNNGASAAGSERTFPKISGSGVFVFGTRGAMVNYKIARLEDWNGVVTNNATASWIESVISGNGKIVFANSPELAPIVSNEFSGTIELAFDYNNFDIAKYGGANSTIMLGNMSGFLKDGSATDGRTGVIASDVVISGNMTINNGWPFDASIDDPWSQAKVVKFTNRVRVDGSLSLISEQNYDSWSHGKGGFYSINQLDAAGVGSITIGQAFRLKISSIEFAVAPSWNSRLVPLTLAAATYTYSDDGQLYGPNGVVNEAIPVTVGGVATGQKLVYVSGANSGLYLAVAQFGGNYYATFQDAIDARAAAGGSGDILVLDASAPVPEGYRIVDGKLVPNKKPAVLIFF